jgi:hypothetical protein
MKIKVTKKLKTQDADVSDIPNFEGSEIYELDGIQIDVSKEGNEISKQAVKGAVANMIRTNQLNSDIVDYITIFESYIYIKSKNEKEIKSGNYQIAAKAAMALRPDGTTSKHIGKYVLEPMKGKDALANQNQLLAKKGKDNAFEDVDTLYEELLDRELFTEGELQLLTNINGYSVNTLNDALYARHGYRSLAQMLGEDEDYEDEDYADDKVLDMEQNDDQVVDAEQVDYTMLANNLLDIMIESMGLVETCETLLGLGYTDDQLYSLGFEEETIESAKSGNEDEDYLGNMFGDVQGELDKLTIKKK